MDADKFYGPRVGDWMPAPRDPVDIDDILDRHSNKTYGNHVRAEWAYEDVPRLVADIRLLRRRVADLEAFVQRVANEAGPWGDPTCMIDLADDAAELLRGNR